MKADTIYYFQRTVKFFNKTEMENICQTHNFWGSGKFTPVYYLSTNFTFEITLLEFLTLKIIISLHFAPFAPLVFIT